MPQQLLTPKQAAERLNIKPTTLARWRWEGTGPRFVKIGKAVRYAECDIEVFIQAGTRRSTSDPGET